MADEITLYYMSAHSDAMQKVTAELVCVRTTGFYVIFARGRIFNTHSNAGNSYATQEFVFVSCGR